jgi:hypothetical protein
METLLAFLGETECLIRKRARVVIRPLFIGLALKPMAHIGAFTNRLGGGKPSQVGEAAASSGNGFSQLRARDPEQIRTDHHLPNNVDAHATIICPHLVNFGLSAKGPGRRGTEMQRHEAHTDRFGGEQFSACCADAAGT